MIDPLLESAGRAAGEWLRGVQCTFQGFQSNIAETLPRIPMAFQERQVGLKNGFLRHSKSLEDADKKSIEFAKDLESWRRNPTWVDETPVMEISVPAGSLCQINTTFKVGLPPKILFDILSDPANKRVFKDIKEVKYRKVLEDHGDRQVVELEQVAIWRFLCLSGTLSVFVKVDQNRKDLSLSYELGKPGFMKRFEGFWSIKPLFVDSYEDKHGGRVASLVELHQVVEPALIPPPPIDRYVRGITSRSIERMLSDLQAEGKRLREDIRGGTLTTESTADEEDVDNKQGLTVLHKWGLLPLRASGSSWRNQRKRWRHMAS